jgi:hypothetical protein
MFQEWRLPCSYAITAIRFTGREVHKWVAPFWEPTYIIIGNAYYMGENIEILLYMRIIKTDNIIPNICDDEYRAPRLKGPKAGPN